MDTTQNSRSALKTSSASKRPVTAPRPPSSHSRPTSSQASQAEVRLRITQSKAQRKDLKSAETSKRQSQQTQLIDQAKQVPLDVLAKQWLDESSASIETRCYLVENLLPTVIMGLEKLLIETEKKGLVNATSLDQSFNPINILAQYLMRNNPRFSNFAEASPYMMSMRLITEELRLSVYDAQNDKATRLKAEAIMRKKNAEEQVAARHEKDRAHLQLLVSRFDQWKDTPEGGLSQQRFHKAVHALASDLDYLLHEVSAVVSEPLKFKLKAYPLSDESPPLFLSKQDVIVALESFTRPILEEDKHAEVIIPLLEKALSEHLVRSDTGIGASTTSHPPVSDEDSHVDAEEIHSEATQQPDEKKEDEQLQEQQQEQEQKDEQQGQGHHDDDTQQALEEGQSQGVQQEQEHAQSDASATPSTITVHEEDVSRQEHTISEEHKGAESENVEGEGESEKKGEEVTVDDKGEVKEENVTGVGEGDEGEEHHDGEKKEGEGVSEDNRGIQDNVESDIKLKEKEETGDVKNEEGGEEEVKTEVAEGKEDDTQADQAVPEVADTPVDSSS